LLAGILVIEKFFQSLWYSSDGKRAGWA